MHGKPAKTITRKQTDLLLFAHIFNTLMRFLEQGMLLIFLMYEVVTNQENVGQAIENEGKCY